MAILHQKQVLLRDKKYLRIGKYRATFCAV